MAWTANPRDPSRQSAKPRCRAPPARMSAHRDGVSGSDMGLPPSLQWDAEHRDHCGLAVSVSATTMHGGPPVAFSHQAFLKSVALASGLHWPSAESKVARTETAKPR